MALLRSSRFPADVPALGARDVRVAAVALKGITFDRKIKIEALYEPWVPIPAEEVDDAQHVQAFVDALKHLVRKPPRRLEQLS